MKRSEINSILKDTILFLDKMNFRLPPFAFWSPEDWAKRDTSFDEIRDNMLGWDITDYGHGKFNEIGLLLFTIRNGNIEDRKYKKPYAEKLLVVRENQITPYHFHWKKMEDIINRGGGNLLVKVFGSTTDGALDTAPVPVNVDGHAYTVEAGTVIKLTPGESVTLPTGQYHKFWGEEGFGTVLVGEVSMVNDDKSDNRFLETQGRFPVIEEDEAPLYLLCSEYPKKA
jgi:D-lyxose ketol-isomerase